MQVLDRRKALAITPLWRLGFRPFFLGGGLFALLAVPLWLAAGGWLVWHRHELLFGFALAIIAGFLLSAVQTWTGQPGLQGRPLMLLAAALAGGTGGLAERSAVARAGRAGVGVPAGGGGGGGGGDGARAVAGQAETQLPDRLCLAAAGGRGCGRRGRAGQCQRGTAASGRAGRGLAGGGDDGADRRTGDSFLHPARAGSGGGSGSRNCTGWRRCSSAWG